MRLWIARVNASPKYGRAFQWGKLVAITGSAQLTIQFISLLCGILVVRVLTPNEYALYTLANTMLGTMVLLSDGGISAGLMSLAGRVWQDKVKLGNIYTTAFNLRKKFAVASLIIAIPILYYFLMHHNSGWLRALLIILALIPAFYTSLSSSLLEIIPKLTQQIAPVQKIEVTTSLTRLILLSLSILIFPWAFIAILANGLPQLWANAKLKLFSNKLAVIGHHSDKAIEKQILHIVKRVLPGTVYYCVSGQITIWLISIFGNTSSVAQVGALGRIAMLLSLFSVLFNVLVTPRFSRLPDRWSILFPRFLQVTVGILFLGVIITGLVYLCSSQLLWILGPQYSSFKNELVLNIIGSCLSLTLGILFSINYSRGWIMNPLIGIPLNLSTIVLGITLINISTIKGLFHFNILVMGVEVIIYFSYGIYKMWKIKKAESFP